MQHTEKKLSNIQTESFKIFILRNIIKTTLNTKHLILHKSNHIYNTLKKHLNKIIFIT